MDIERLEQVFSRTRMVGWDFSVLDGRLVADEPPWDFEADCLSAMANAQRVADLGTGGGERLITLLAGAPTRPAQVVATEGWPPNVAVAESNLSAFGVEVRAYDAASDARMPFDDDSLDLVMARHDDYDAAEIARVLAPGGVFLTQQVDGRDALELREWFGGDAQYPEVRLDRHIADAEAAGFSVVRAEEWAGTMRFADAEALVTYLALVPWNVPDFAVREHERTLRSLDAHRPIEVTQRRFMLSLRT